MSGLHWVLTLAVALVFAGCQAGGPADEAASGQPGAGVSLLTKVAEKPPLGWNSFDI